MDFLCSYWWVQPHFSFLLIHTIYLAGERGDRFREYDDVNDVYVGLMGDGCSGCLWVRDLSNSLDDQRWEVLEAVISCKIFAVGLSLSYPS